LLSQVHSVGTPVVEWRQVLGLQLNTSSSVTVGLSPSPSNLLTLWAVICLANGVGEVFGGQSRSLLFPAGRLLRPLLSRLHSTSKQVISKYRSPFCGICLLCWVHISHPRFYLFRVLVFVLPGSPEGAFLFSLHPCCRKPSLPLLFLLSALY
jgi:hypothetical protein